MNCHETLRRVSAIQQSCGPPAYRLPRRITETRSRVPQRGGSESQQTRTSKGKQKEKAERIYAFRFRPLGNRQLERCVFISSALRRQFCIGQTLPHDLGAQTAKAVRSRSTGYPSSRDCCSGILADPRSAQGGMVQRKHKFRPSCA